MPLLVPSDGLECPGVAWGWPGTILLSGNYPGTIRELSGILGELAVGPCWPGWLGLAGLAAGLTGLAWPAWLALFGWPGRPGWLRG